ncbi:hypothetical protein ElyMa_003639600 [Elysia marginata]|uniref:Uncharacterized protein n=1 Tax=Elysia marginata TaxID=1093978 RepID=A0AAV4EVF3_9GAST|nr:hypothetical protein ElyMa_003639600 [Elysia marginata]
MVATSTPEMLRIRTQHEESLKRKERKNKAKGPAKKLCFEIDDDSASDISLSDMLEGSNDEFDDESNVLKLDVVENVHMGDYVVVEFAKKTQKFYKCTILAE